MKLIALVGSLRKESYNMQLAYTMRERYSEKFDLEIANIGELPYFDQDIEENPPPVVKEFKKQIKEADGVIIITPEYNWSIPGVLKNALDWLSRVDLVMAHKPVMTAGVSIGLMGTIRAQLHIRQILSSPGIQAKVLPPAKNEIVINLAQTKFSEDTSRLVETNTLDYIDQVIDRYVDFVSDQGRLTN